MILIQNTINSYTHTHTPNRIKTRVFQKQSHQKDTSKITITRKQQYYYRTKQKSNISTSWNKNSYRGSESWSTELPRREVVVFVLSVYMCVYIYRWNEVSREYAPFETYRKATKIYVHNTYNSAAWFTLSASLVLIFCVLLGSTLLLLLIQNWNNKYIIILS